MNSPETIADIVTQVDIGEVMDAIDGFPFEVIFGEQSYDFANKVAVILRSHSQDKMGLINDLHYETKRNFAEWLIDAPNSTVTIPLKKKLGVPL